MEVSRAAVEQALLDAEATRTKAEQAFMASVKAYNAAAPQGASSQLD